MWVAASNLGKTPSGSGEWVMNVNDVKEFLDNVNHYKARANIINMYSKYDGMSLLDGWKSTWTPQNVLAGAIGMGGAMLLGAQINTFDDI